MSADDDIAMQDKPAESSAGGGLVLFTDLITLPSFRRRPESRVTS